MAKKVRLSEKEENFVEYLMAGIDQLEAYRKCWLNNYNDAKARHAARVILAKEHVSAYMQSMLLERKGGVVLDEEFVISNLKKIVIEKPNSNQAVRSLELLGKYQAMWIDKSVVEDNVSQRDIADKIYERRMKIERGETVEPIEDVKEKGAEVIEFELYNGTNG